MLYLRGHVVNENEMIWFTVNSSSPQMREEVEPVANDFLSRNLNRRCQGQPLPHRRRVVVYRQLGSSESQCRLELQK
ncbi:MAG: hypothetical protein CM1200mP29_01280 [Verrucomicrobiota bacterium]|nr:MAG: hypothetical protein CM1200mP29_01280 [Verrucomicrobiota bacterium]